MSRSPLCHLLCSHLLQMTSNLTSAFGEVLQYGAEELESVLEGEDAAYVTPEVHKAIEGALYIAEHLKDEDDIANVSPL